MGKILLTLAVLVGFTANSHAKLAGPIGSCTVKANDLKGGTINLIGSVGGIESGNAVITCTAAGQKTVSKKAAVIIEGIGLGAGFPITTYKNIKLDLVMVGVTDANDLFGRYNFGAMAGLTVVKKAAGTLVMASLDNGVSLKAGLYSGDAMGLDVHAHAMVMRVMTQAQFKKMVDARQ